jgi:tetratricopeptide (TPR) repeat protein
MGESREALDALDQCLTIHPKHIKALYIKGKVLLMMGETQEAINVLIKSLELDSSNVEVKKELVKAQTKHRLQYENEKKLYKKMISGVMDAKSEADIAAGKLKAGLKNKNDSSYTTLIAAGLAIALVSVGLALYSKYRN